MAEIIDEDLYSLSVGPLLRPLLRLGFQGGLEKPLVAVLHRRLDLSACRRISLYK